jgi:hypothetical protein
VITLVFTRHSCKLAECVCAEINFIYRLEDVRKLGRVVILALFGALPWDRVLFGLIHTGLPLIAYLFSTMICKHVLQKPSLLWIVGWKCLKIIFLALISAFLAVCTWRSVRPSITEIPCKSPPCTKACLKIFKNNPSLPIKTMARADKLAAVNKAALIIHLREFIDYSLVVRVL